MLDTRHILPEAIDGQLKRYLIKTPNLTRHRIEQANEIKKKRKSTKTEKKIKKPLNVSVAVDTPKFTIAVTAIGGTGVKHANIIIDKDIARLPGKASADSIIIGQGIQLVPQSEILIFDPYLARRESCLCRIPRLMPTHTWKAGLRMCHDQGQILHLCIPESIIVHSPCSSLQPF